MNDPIKLPTTKIDSFFIRRKMASSKGAAIDIGDGLYGFLSNWPDEVRKIIKADESRNHTVYIHLLPTSIYIGQTSTKPEDRWRRGEGYRDNKLFYANIKKYGWDNIKHKVLTSHLTKDEADIVESSLIRYFSNHEKETGLTVLNLTLNERSGETNVISHVKEIVDYAETASGETVESSPVSTDNGKTNNKWLSKPVLQFTLAGEFVKEWPSMMEAGRNGFNQSTISKCCLGDQKSHHGYIWKFKN